MGTEEYKPDNSWKESSPFYTYTDGKWQFNPQTNTAAPFYALGSNISEPFLQGYKPQGSVPNKPYQPAQPMQAPPQQGTLQQMMQDSINRYLGSQNRIRQPKNPYFGAGYFKGK